jgi:hypothetical protein
MRQSVRPVDGASGIADVSSGSQEAIRQRRLCLDSRSKKTSVRVNDDSRIVMHRASILLLCCIVLTTLALKNAGVAQAEATSSPTVVVQIDLTAAEAILEAATSDPAHAAESADTALELAPVTAMIAKEHKYNVNATAATFRADVISAAAGLPTRVFPLKAVRDDPKPAREMLASLRSNRAVIAKRLGDGLQSFAPDGTAISATLIILLGSNQYGWVPDQKATVFYADVGRHLGDVDGLMALAAHELFHVVQGVSQPEWSPLFAELPKTAPQVVRIRHQLRAAFANLVIEGMATYVGDPDAWGATHEGFDHDKREYARELARSSETFALFDTIIYRLARDSHAPQDLLLTIGFGGSWDQTGYYVGYQMAKVIDRFLGRDRLRALVARTPEEFLSDYITVAQAHPDDPAVKLLAKPTIATVQYLTTHSGR